MIDMRTKKKALLVFTVSDAVNLHDYEAIYRLDSKFINDGYVNKNESITCIFPGLVKGLLLP